MEMQEAKPRNGNNQEKKRTFSEADQRARMFVPKMAKNGFNSVLQTSAGSRRLVAARN
jgi:transposase-like protein